MDASAPADEALLAKIRALLESEPCAVIGIDGKDGSGKSFLCNQLSAQLGLPAIHVDDFINKHKGGFLEHLQIDALASALSGRSGATLVEGVCLLQVLAKVGVQPQFLVYVKRLSPHGWWQDEGECDFAGSFDALVEQQRQDGLPCMPALDSEVLSYHLAHRPHRVANHVYHRVEH